MTNIGLPVPSGFPITTEVCNDYYKEGAQMPAGLMDEAKTALHAVEAKIGKTFGDTNNPLPASLTNRTFTV